MPPVICNQLPQNMVVMSMTHMKIVNFQCTWTSWSSFMSLTQMKIVNFQYSWTSWSSDSSVVAFSQFHVCIKSVLTSLGYHSVIIMYWDNESFKHAIIKVRHEQQGLLVGLATQVNKQKIATTNLVIQWMKNTDAKTCSQSDKQHKWKLKQNFQCSLKHWVRFLSQCYPIQQR